VEAISINVLLSFYDWDNVRESEKRGLLWFGVRRLRPLSHPSARWT